MVYFFIAFLLLVSWVGCDSYFFLVQIFVILCALCFAILPLLSGYFKVVWRLINTPLLTSVDAESYILLIISVYSRRALIVLDVT